MERISGKTGRQGMLEYWIIILLNKKPASGYDIAKEMNLCTFGAWKPTTGGLYPALHKLEEKKLIKGRKSGKRGKISYSLTEEGSELVKKIRKHLIENKENLRYAAAFESMLWPDEPNEIRQEFHCLKNSIMAMRDRMSKKYTKDTIDAIVKKIRKITKEIEELS